MKQITVGARRSDPKHYGVRKYDNEAHWNRPGETAPNGVGAYRWVRDTTPDISQLTALAAWLVEHVPSFVAGTMPHPQKQFRIRCFNGRTQAEQLLHEASTQQKANGVYCDDPAKAIARAQGLLKTYAGFLDRPQEVDWLFPIIEPNQTDEEYWNMVATQMMKAGVTRILIGTTEWRGQ